MHWKLMSRLVCCALLLLTSCDRPTSFKKASAAEAEGRYSDAYQLYATALIEGSQSFKAPAFPEIKSVDDFEKWMIALIAQYVAYRESKPSDDDCENAIAALIKLEPVPQ